MGHERHKFVIRTEDDFLSAHLTPIQPRARRQSSEARASMYGPSAKKSKKVPRSHAIPHSEKRAAGY